MAEIITREVGATAKGSPLTNAEVDQNFINLNADVAGKAATVHTHEIASVTGLQTALDGKQPTIGFTPENAANKGAISGYASLDATGKVPTAQLPLFGAVDSVAGKTGVVTLVKADVGLDNVDNTSDLNKPISTAVQTALDGKASVASVSSKLDATGGAASGITLNDGYTEEVFALTGTTTALSPSNGSVQTWTLTGNSNPTDGLSNGQSITLGIDDGTAFTITWPSVTWATTPSSAPTLATTGLTWVVLWKVGGVLYGKY